MSIKQILTLSVACIALLAETALAQGTVPANVKEVSVLLDGGAVTVSFEPVSDAAFYRIYYSDKSILGSSGDYDDFERTNGTETRFTFKTVPLSVPKMYVAVLAVNLSGVESEGFETEASVDLLTGPSSAPGVAPPFMVISVESASSTGILVTFSKRLKGQVILTPEHFIITNGSGVLLSLKRVLVGQTTVLIDTERQTPGTSYIFGILQDILAEDGTSVTPVSPQVQFFGYGEEKTLPSSSSSSSSSSAYARNPATTSSSVPATVPDAPPPVQDSPSLTLKASLRKDGMYDVTAEWAPAPNAAGYTLYTSRDAAEYTWNSTTLSADHSAQYRKLTSGLFGVRVRARDAEENESKGIERVITLPASGLGILGIMIASGIGTAHQAMRKRKKTVSLLGRNA